MGGNPEETWCHPDTWFFMHQENQEEGRSIGEASPFMPRIALRTKASTTKEQTRKCSFLPAKSMGGFWGNPVVWAL